MDAPEPTPAAPERPNVVFILADDLSVDALNRNISEYPNIEALAARGVSFTNSFVTDPVCCPSRATNLTGMYRHNHGVDMDNKEPAFRALDDRALPVWLDGAAGFVKGSGGPFFAYVAPYVPHKPAAHPRRYDGLFAGTRAPRTPSFNERDVSDKPRWVRGRARLSAEQVKGADATYEDMLRSTKDSTTWWAQW